MKKQLLLFAVFAVIAFSAKAQVTHEVYWGENTASNITINQGDTVMWICASCEVNHTVSTFSGPENFYYELNGPESYATHTFNTVGTISYTCINEPDFVVSTVTVEGALSTNEFSLNKFSIAPNPGVSELNIKLPNLVDNVEVTVFTLLGKQIHNSVLLNEQTSIDVSDWSAGIYLVKLKSGNKSIIKRFFKQ
ncbi:T9SS type A sorting domain-containing protein [Mangrovimonas sp. YM274]|uniref:T9SS type A sorting domain-containing protein n=1 Tax=Mangrovimonas sp. YM274 TaxID=3070660 RepID=UPI0027DB1243|nr:T9SS type A sorting domain-containing protein [Mangrovimonas sp. YM274]WMI70274.1 T9SS type A sorting domain-containing protein [Mangrovimonas sp. YM274]